MTRAALSRKALFAATGVLVVAMAVAAVWLTTRGGDTPHAWIAVAPVLDPDVKSGPIRVLDAFAPGKERAFGPSGRYVSLKWSPDGGQLGAFQIPAENSLPSFVLFDRESGRRRSIALPEMVIDYAWSPDSSRIAIGTTGAVFVLDRNGHKLGRVDVPPPPDRGGSASGVAPRNWSPDSRYFATRRNNHVIVVDRDGHGAAYDPDDFIQGGNRQGVQLLGWTARTEFLVNVLDFADPTQSRIWAVTVQPNGVSWRETEISLDDTIPVQLQKLLEDARAHFGEFAYRTHLSAEGTALLVELRQKQDPGKNPRIVLLHEGKETPIDLGLDLNVLVPPLIRSLDVVITGAEHQ